MSDKVDKDDSSGIGLVPDFFIAACTHMQLDALMEALQKGGGDLAVVESYPYVAGELAWTPEPAMWRLGNAKKAGIVERTIPAVWIAPKDETFTAEWLEGWIRRFRKELPQMPGLAPFFPDGYDRTSPHTQRLARACDRLAAKYYLDLAPKVRLVAPWTARKSTCPCASRPKRTSPSRRGAPTSERDTWVIKGAMCSP